MNQKMFVRGKITEKVFDNGGKVYNVWIPGDELERIKGENGINFTISFGKESGLPYMTESTFKPKEQF